MPDDDHRHVPQDLREGEPPKNFLLGKSRKYHSEGPSGFVIVSEDQLMPAHGAPWISFSSSTTSLMSGVPWHRPSARMA